MFIYASWGEKTDALSYRESFVQLVYFNTLWSV